MCGRVYDCVCVCVVCVVSGYRLADPSGCLDVWVFGVVFADPDPVLRVSQGVPSCGPSRESRCSGVLLGCRVVGLSRRCLAGPPRIIPIKRFVLLENLIHIRNLIRIRHRNPYNKLGTGKHLITHWGHVIILEWVCFSDVLTFGIHQPDLWFTDCRVVDLKYQVWLWDMSLVSHRISTTSVSCTNTIRITGRRYVLWKINKRLLDDVKPQIFHSVTHTLDFFVEWCRQFVVLVFLNVLRAHRWWSYLDQFWLNVCHAHRPMNSLPFCLRLVPCRNHSGTLLHVTVISRVQCSWIIQERDW